MTAGVTPNSAANAPSIGVWKCTVVADVKTATASSVRSPRAGTGRGIAVEDTEDGVTKPAPV